MRDFTAGGKAVCKFRSAVSGSLRNSKRQDEQADAASVRAGLFSKIILCFLPFGRTGR